MPQRRGLAGFGAGIGAGISEAANTLQHEATTMRREKRAQTISLFKDMSDKVMAGTVEPEQAEAELRKLGVNVPRGYFDDVQPSVEGELKKIIGGITNAASPQTVPTDAALKATFPSRLPLRQLANNAEGPVPPTAGDEYPLSDTFQSLLGARDEKMKMFAPERVEAYNPTSGATETRFLPSDPRTLAGSSVQKTPTPQQEGANKAISTIAQTSGELAGGLPELKAEGFTRQEAGERGAKVDTSKALAQGQIDVQTSPGNVSKEARRQVAIRVAVEKAVQDMKEAGVPPQMATSFMHTSSTGTPYAYIDAGMPPEIRSVATRRLATTMPGIRFLNRQQNDAMNQVEGARDNLRTLMTAYASSLPKSPGGRLIGGPRNRLDMMLQRNPQLDATYKAMYGPMIEIFRGATAGVQGFRMTQNELAKAQNAIPVPTDTYEDALKKVATLGQVFSDIEKQLIGR